MTLGITLLCIRRNSDIIHVRSHNVTPILIPDDPGTGRG